MLSFKRFLAEVKNEAHVASTVMTGVDPHTHMGHISDLGGVLKKLPGDHKIFAMSSKSKAFPDEDRKKILTKQTGGGIEPLIAHEHDDIVAHAWSKVKDHPGKKVLHLVGGQDRKGMVDRLVDNMKTGKIKNPGFDNIKGHTPTGAERSHGMSGTKMRAAAASGDMKTYRNHLGTAFTPKEAADIMAKTKESIAAGTTKLKRK
jgi:hypothetical protein